MKICISEKKSYLPRYLIFSFFFIVLLLGLIFFSFRVIHAPPSSTVLESDAKRPVVIIDAGHGGEDGGAVGVNGVYEKDLNLSIAQKLDELLRANGIQTVMTRTEDILLYDRTSDYQGQKKVQDLAARRKIAEEYAPAVFVSIHMNAFPQSKYSGLQVYYSTNASQSATLANKIQAMTKEALLPQNNRQIKPAGENIYLLDRLRCPAVLIECGFLSNPEECAKLSDDDYRQQLALMIGLSICEYLSENGS